MERQFGAAGFEGLMVRLTSWAGAAALVAATAAVAAPPAGRPAPARIFLSPSGEPFRPSPSDPDPIKAWFDKVDAAHKGYIDREAFRADAARFFKQLDENGDGVIDGFEVADYEAKVAPELADAAEGRLPGQYGPGGGRGRGGQARQDQGEAPQGQGGFGRSRTPQRPIIQLIDEPEPVSGADFALDGHITLAEWMRATDRRFEILDANKDGRLTLDELKARFLPIKK